MERFCFTFDIRPGTEDEYKKRHDEIWPELVTAIQDAGITNYSLFRRGTTIIAYCECEPDPATAFAVAIRGLRDTARELTLALGGRLP